MVLVETRKYKLRVCCKIRGSKNTIISSYVSVFEEDEYGQKYNPEELIKYETLKDLSIGFIVKAFI